ncbi:hypothetical protein BHECKSOX_540 [Bathymodiolus heckerae thiotrophic gill symbiont]|uniref:hypothetical protein n=1 Tax=Bathymodiolus heckerae thiotrophic gill symbiont TaxID=1052212 RepID=UPI0010B8664A|nr:hypothetical protein [Bathymodiolus heckerae thiotrophic gill symbiont]SHN90357.1 hypothetical protein BHECKSOX_540 [Bathymodiolus heckerae thiotrophic gill symbiont]
MPAHNEHFLWMSYYQNYNFFVQRMNKHSKVNSINSANPSLYNIELTNGKALKVFICECYAFDVAEYVEACENYDELDAVVISSNWCSYSLDVKRRCMSENVGVFDTSGFMAAINRNEFWTYLTQYEQERFQENGWL